MKWLKRILLALVAVVLLLVIATFLLPGEWEVTRTRDMPATRAEIHAQIADWDKWPAWSPFEKEDPNMVITIDGPSSGVGASRSWKSETQGDGSMTITMTDPEKGLSFDLQMVGFPQFEGHLLFEDGDTADTTKVVWVDRGVNTGVGKWFGLLMDSFVGAKFEQGLLDLEAAVLAAR